MWSSSRSVRYSFIDRAVALLWMSILSEYAVKNSSCGGFVDDGDFTRATPSRCSNVPMVTESPSGVQIGHHCRSGWWPLPSPAIVGVCDVRNRVAVVKLDSLREPETGVNANIVSVDSSTRFGFSNIILFSVYVRGSCTIEGV